MRDVHDGLGGLLVQAHAIAQREGSSRNLRDVLSAALTDLRLIVSSLDPVSGELSRLVADFRHLHARMCSLDECDYRWNVDSIGQIELGATRSLSILRILQEALANVARHARATRVVVTMTPSPSNGLCLSVLDDGVGISDRCTEAGRGIASMKGRAAELRGSLTVKRAEPGPGTLVTLTVPCDRLDETRTHALADTEIQPRHRRPAGVIRSGGASRFVGVLSHGKAKAKGQSRSGIRPCSTSR